jgi:hypothetical protein
MRNKGNHPPDWLLFYRAIQGQAGLTVLIASSANNRPGMDRPGFFIGGEIEIAGNKKAPLRKPGRPLCMISEWQTF